MQDNEPESWDPWFDDYDPEHPPEDLRPRVRLLGFAALAVAGMLAMCVACAVCA